MPRRSRDLFPILGLWLVLLAAVGLAQSARPGAGKLPQQLSDEEFWKLVVDYSATGGAFPFENFMSNEDGFQTVIPELKRTIRPGSVYIGVGPEQNFTYISALRPGMAFIVDIRRQNMLEHLMYKALFEMSANRVEFVSRLFSRKAPSGFDKASSAMNIFKAYERATADRAFFQANLSEITDRLMKTHKFALSGEDRVGIAKVYSAFFDGGPTMDYRFNNSDRMPSPGATYTELMSSTDRDGRNWGYLETEENFRIVQDYEKRNLIVPLVDDFAGAKSIRAVGRYVKERGEIVSVFYTSNVDQYLFGDNVEDRFYENVATLPIDASSAFIRTIHTINRGARFDATNVQAAPGNQWAVLLCSIEELLNAAKAGEILSQSDVNRISR